MKIKKKEYNKALQDMYWRGVKAGISFALDSPKTAKKYADNIDGLRFVSERAKTIVDSIVKSIVQRGDADESNH